MFKNIWISIFFSSLLFSSVVFSNPPISGPSVRYFSAFNVHSLNKSKISDAECRALFPSKWTKSTATLKRGQVTQIDFGDFKMLDMRTRVVQPGVYDAVLKKIPEKNSLSQDIRHGTMKFQLHGKPTSSPATMIATFHSSDVRGPDSFAKLIYVFKSRYCAANIKSKKNL